VEAVASLPLLPQAQNRPTIMDRTRSIARNFVFFMCVSPFSITIPYPKIFWKAAVFAFWKRTEIKLQLSLIFW
jgi:hypothetical protein